MSITDGQMTVHSGSPFVEAGALLLRRGGRVRVGIQDVYCHVGVLESSQMHCMLDAPGEGAPYSCLY